MGRIIYMVSPTALLGRRGRIARAARPHCSGGEARPPRGAESAQALRCADRGYVLATGTIVLTGSGEALLKSNEVQAAYLGGAAKARA
jgi:ABC-type cobalamin transport system ATPase subunit